MRIQDSDRRNRESSRELFKHWLKEAACAEHKGALE
jgi:hypothetical protein